MPNKIVIGSLCNRDLEIFEEIKKYSQLYNNIKIVNLLKNGSNAFSLKHLKKKLKKYTIHLIIVKLFSEESNKEIYEALNKFAPHIPRLNSLKSVRTCESRKNTFKLIEEKCKKITIPKCFYSINSAYEAVSNGIPLIIKMDTHNIKNMSKYDRIVGIAKNPHDFLKLIKHYNVKNNILFFQEYLGKTDIVYKVYIIDKYVQTIISKNLVRENKISHLELEDIKVPIEKELKKKLKKIRKNKNSNLELEHIKVTIDKELKRRLRRLGRKFGMSIFGVDYILKDGVAYVVDVNDFPSFQYIPEAISLISDYTYKLIDARQTLIKLPMSIKVKTYMT